MAITLVLKKIDAWNQRHFVGLRHSHQTVALVRTSDWRTDVKMGYLTIDRLYLVQIFKPFDNKKLIGINWVIRSLVKVQITLTLQIDVTLTKVCQKGIIRFWNSYVIIFYVVWRLSFRKCHSASDFICLFVCSHSRGHNF